LLTNRVSNLQELNQLQQNQQLQHQILQAQQIQQQDVGTNNSSIATIATTIIDDYLQSLLLQHSLQAPSLLDYKLESQFASIIKQCLYSEPTQRPSLHKLYKLFNKYAMMDEHKCEMILGVDKLVIDHVQKISCTIVKNFADKQHWHAYKYCGF